MQSPAITAFGQGLRRPECVLAHSSGLIFVPNWTQTGGISVLNPAGQCRPLLSTDAQKHIKPNGIALESTHANGTLLPPTNFVATDKHGRIWITVSTTKTPRSADYRPSANTGFIAMAHPGESNARIVADNIGYTNECVVDLDQAAVFVNETFGRRLTRFDLADDGSLTNRSVVTRFSNGTYPDGVTIDDEGNFWVTSIVSNRIIKVSPDGDQTLILEDCDNVFLKNVESAYEQNRMGPEHLASTGNTGLANISSLAFGGEQLSTVYIGNLLGHCLHCFEANVKGRKPVHWDVPLGYLESFFDADKPY